MRLQRSLVATTRQRHHARALNRTACGRRGRTLARARQINQRDLLSGKARSGGASASASVMASGGMAGRDRNGGATEPRKGEARVLAKAVHGSEP